MLSAVAFSVLGFVILVAAINCISAENVIHGAYWLLLCAIGVAGMTWFMGAEYLAVTQLLLYAGAVSILTIFTVMVTHRSYESACTESKLSVSAVILSLAFLGLVAYGIIMTPELAAFTTAQEPMELADFGAELFAIDGHAFAFEIASLVLLAALIAAVWWSKDSDLDGERIAKDKAARIEDPLSEHSATLNAPLRDEKKEQQSAEGQEDSHA
ncbi:MAG: NADH-quinone oxidoreductase subunit J [Coriobacteriia bacterium]|nr:NADH-quinone oxidoreductase subunit J [Coriobacteriia bacterium]